MSNQLAVTEIEFSIDYDLGTGIDFGSADELLSTSEYQEQLLQILRNHYPKARITVNISDGIGGIMVKRGGEWLDSHIEIDDPDIEFIGTLSSDLFVSDSWYIDADEE